MADCEPHLFYMDSDAAVWLFFCGDDSDTLICCVSWAKDFPGGSFNQAYMLFSFLSICFLCDLVLPKMEPISETFTLSSCFAT